MRESASLCSPCFICLRNCFSVSCKKPNEYIMAFILCVSGRCWCVSRRRLETMWEKKSWNRCVEGVSIGNRKGSVGQFSVEMFEESYHSYWLEKKLLLRGPCMRRKQHADPLTLNLGSTEGFDQRFKSIDINVWRSFLTSWINTFVGDLCSSKWARIFSHFRTASSKSVSFKSTSSVEFDDASMRLSRVWSWSSAQRREAIELRHLDRCKQLPGRRGILWSVYQRRLCVQPFRCAPLKKGVLFPSSFFRTFTLSTSTEWMTRSDRHVTGMHFHLTRFGDMTPASNPDHFKPIRDDIICSEQSQIQYRTTFFQLVDDRLIGACFPSWGSRNMKGHSTRVSISTVARCIW